MKRKNTNISFFSSIRNPTKHLILNGYGFKEREKLLDEIRIIEKRKMKEKV